MTFNEWFCEQEIFNVRCERFYEDLDNFRIDSDEAENCILDWMKAAYEVGYENGKSNV